MGYLVQRKFKNGFKDVRISDLTYYNRLEDILDYSNKEELRWEAVIPRLYFESPEIAKAYADSLNAEFGEGLIEVKETKIHNYEQDEDYECYTTTASLPIVKVWELVDGEYLSKGKTVYVTPYGVFDKSQVLKTVNVINKEFKEYNIYDDAVNNWSKYYNANIDSRYSD